MYGKPLFFAASVTALFFLSSSVPASAGTTYLFTVSCPDKRFVDEWDTGDIDSGQEHLRFVAGNGNPGCSVTDYDPATDSNLPREKHDGGGAVATGVIRSVPLVGNIVCGIFGC